MLAAEFVQILPTIKSCIVTVIENKADCIVANGLDRRDFHLSLTRDHLFLARSMALDFRARRLNPKIFGRKLESLARIETSCEKALTVIES